MISKTYSLQRFIDAQTSTYNVALSEIKNGKKQSHWIWFIFPQVKGLGLSSTSKYYAIENIDEATAYLNDSVLRKRLIEICEVLLKLESNNATKIFGSPDDIKLKSSMTLFASLQQNPVFDLVLKKFFNGMKDEQTLAIISS